MSERTRIVHEIQAADMLGFTRMADFRRAVTRKRVPEPTRHLGPRDPVWALSDIEAWLNEKKPGIKDVMTEDDVLRKVKEW